MSIPLPGYAYYDPEFHFIDGQVGRKLFVVLCDSILDDEFVVAARTTSNPKSESAAGCYPDNYPPCFFVSTDLGIFNEPTWIMLDYIVEYSKARFDRWKKLTALPIATHVDLLRCGERCITLEKWAAKSFGQAADMLAP